MIPDVIVRAMEDKYINRFIDTIRDSIEVSKASGMLFNTLASKRLHEPTEKDIPTLKESTRLEDYGEHMINNIKSVKGVGNLSRLLFAGMAGKERFEEDPIFRYETEKPAEDTENQYEVRQTFHQSILNESKSNIIEEPIVNYIFKDEVNFCSSGLKIHNLESQKTIDLSLFLPRGYVFSPGKMYGNRKEEHYTDEEGKEQVRYSVDLRILDEYNGTQSGDDSGDFFQSSRGVVAYGDLTKRGGMVSLFHEIAHAWHGEYRKEHPKQNFKEYYKELYDIVLRASLVQKIKIEDIEEKINDKQVIDDIKKGRDEMNNKLKELGIEITNKEEKDITLDKNEYALQDLENIKIKTDKLKPLIEEFVAQERDAWAHAIKVIRFLRKKGLI